MWGTGGRGTRARRALLLGALLAFEATDGRGGTHCPDPAQVNLFGAPGAELRAAADVESWASATPFATPIAAVVDGITPFGGVFHAEMNAAPATRTTTVLLARTVKSRSKLTIPVCSASSVCAPRVRHRRG